MTDPKRITEILDEKTEKLKNNSVDGNFNDNLPTKNGGARPGAGRPKGSISKSNRTTIEAKNRFIDRVKAHVDELFDAQLDLAKGEKVLMVVHTYGEGKNRKRETSIVTDHETIQKYIDWEEGDGDNPDTDENYYYMTTRPANNQALQGLLDRAFGKAPEKIEIEGGFFKADQLNIQIIAPEKITDGPKDKNAADIIEVVDEAEPSPRPTE